MKKKTAVVFSGALLLSTAGMTGCASQDDELQARPSSPVASPSPTAEALASVSAEPELSPFFSDTPLTEDSATAGNFSDGSYEAVGEYQSPAGPEEVQVDLTIAQGVVTAVTVTPQAENEVSLKLQKQMAEGIGELVIGKPLADIEAFAVINGSSLSPIGFQQAVESIREQASQGAGIVN
jgi:uncharacterized protein with FMN-binding domain